MMIFLNQLRLFALINSSSCFKILERLQNACGLKINLKSINRFSAQLMPIYCDWN